MKRHQGHRRHNSFKNSFQSRGTGKYRQQFHGLKNRLGQLAAGQGIFRSRRGIFMGVCRGLAQYFNFSVFWVRVITILLFLFTGFWPIGVMYIVAGLLLKMEPVSPLHDENDREFYDTYTRSRESAISRVKRKFDNIERRIQRMEHTVTSREFDWE
jgi:phage shock protein C